MMKQVYKITLYPVVFSILFISCRTTEVYREFEYPSAEVQQVVVRLIADMPAEHQDEEIWVNEQLVEMGSDAIQILGGLLTDPSASSDTQARYAITSMANYVARPGAEAERDGFEAALLIEIQKNKPVQVKRFLIDQLKPVATGQSVPVLEPLIRDPQFYQPALDVLSTIASGEAVGAIRSAVSQTEESLKVAMIKSLGELRDADSVGMLRRYAISDHWPYQRMALFALSEIGHPGSSQLFRDAMNQQDGYRRIELTGRYLNYAGRLADSGYHDEAGSIADDVLKGNYPANVINNALEIRFRVKGEEILHELLEIAQTSENHVAVTSLKLVNSLSGNEITNQLISAMENASDSRKPLFINSLAERNDRAALPAIRIHLESNSGEIRIAALNAIRSLDEQFNPAYAVAAISRAESYEEISAIESVLHQINSETLVPALIENLPASEAHAKPMLIGILTDRMAVDARETITNELNSEREDVRIAALNYLLDLGEADQLDVLYSMMDNSLTDEEKKPLLNTFTAILNRMDRSAVRLNRFDEFLDQSTLRQRARLVETAPHIEELRVAEIIRQGFSHSFSELREAAHISLISWDDPQALPLIVEAVSRNYAPQKRNELADAYIHIVNAMDEPVNVKADLLNQLVNAVPNQDGKAATINRFSRADDLLALQASGAFFNATGNALRNAAIGIAADVLHPHYTQNSDLFSTSTAVIAVLDEPARSEIKSLLDSRRVIEQRVTEEPVKETVFGELFNGENLDGWEVVGGDPESWGVENGIIYTDGVGSGWLSTTSVYDDFIIELEYRVPAGGNSGVFIRAPREGNPAYQGLEIQILDDFADRYANLQSWQYTGSIYDVLAPSKRVTRPAGEWQQMRIVAEGSKIQVALNGELILSANLIHYQEKVPGHPGLVRRSGHIGLQNHSDRVDFRNIRISPVR
jgi:HEAT repeat protein